MIVRGVVREWQAGEGWGVIDSAETPEGCWAHFSSIQMNGYHSLNAGQSVEFEWEKVADQDGYSYRAVMIWPVPRVPFDVRTPQHENSPAYLSTLTIPHPYDPDSLSRPV